MIEPPVDMDTGEIRQVRPFAAVMQDLGRGAVIDDSAVMLQELVRAVQAHGKKGRFTLTVEIAPMRGEREALIVSATATSKPPSGEPTSGVFFADQHGNLTRDDPRQPALPLRELNPRTTPDKELKQA